MNNMKNYKKTFKAYHVGNDEEFLMMFHPDFGCEIFFVKCDVKNGNAKARYDYCKQNYSFENYTKIRAKRCSENDLYEYNGRNVSEYTLAQYLASNAYRKYLKEFMELNVGKQCYIYSGQWMAWWCDDGGGYTNKFENRGIYEVSELKNWVGHCGSEKQIKFELI